MNQSIVKRSLFFLAIFACIQVPIAAMRQPAARSNYEAINAKHFLACRKITVSNPKDIAAKLFSSGTESECRKSDQISVEYPTRETAVIVHTLIGLADQKELVESPKHKWEKLKEDYSLLQSSNFQVEVAICQLSTVNCQLPTVN